MGTGKLSAFAGAGGRLKKNPQHEMATWTREDEAVKELIRGLGIGLRELKPGTMQFLKRPSRTSWHMPGVSDEGKKCHTCVSVTSPPLCGAGEAVVAQQALTHPSALFSTAPALATRPLRIPPPPRLPLSLPGLQGWARDLVTAIKIITYPASSLAS